MRKISIVLSITLLCLFAVVRRREQQEAEPTMDEFITRVIKDEQVVYQVQCSAEVAENEGADLLRDEPLKASQLLANSMNKGIWVTHGMKLNWLPLDEDSLIDQNRALPLFWNLN